MPQSRLLKKASKAARRSGDHSGVAVTAHGEREAERLVTTGLRKLKLCDGKGNLLPARKDDPRKVALASLLRVRSAINNDWVAKRHELDLD